MLMINPDSEEHAFEVPVSVLPLDGTGTNLTGVGATVRDIWARADLAPLPKSGAATVIKATVGPLDSVFLRLAAP